MKKFEESKIIGQSRQSVELYLDSIGIKYRFYGDSLENAKWNVDIFLNTDQGIVFGYDITKEVLKSKPWEIGIKK